MTEAKLLSPPTNYAVVQLPGRAFPGVVFQGDSLSSIIGDLREAASAPDPDDRDFALNDVIERLEGIQKHYEAVLDGEGISLPYPRHNGS